MLLQYDRNPCSKVSIEVTVPETSGYVYAASIQHGQLFLGRLDTPDWEERLYIMTKLGYVVDVGNGAIRTETGKLRVHSLKLVSEANIQVKAFGEIVLAKRGL